MSAHRSRRLLALPLVLALGGVLCPGSGLAAEEALDTADDLERPHCVFVLGGGQIAIRSYRSFLKLGGGYAHYLSGRMWLDAASMVLVHRYTNFTLNGGLRWKFGRTESGVRAFLRTSLEFAVLAQEVGSTRYALGLRGGGGAGFYPSAGFGLTLEGSVVIGPAFGDGTHFAGAVDILVGTEFAF
jgi:hypothetical protein